jgi:hypothetical protein
VFEDRVLAGSCTLLITGGFTCRMRVTAIPFGFSPREPPRSGGNRRYAGAGRKRDRIPGTGCGACVTGRRGRGTFRVVAEASRCLPDHPLGRDRPVGIVARHSGRVGFATFRRVLSCSIAAARTRIPSSFRPRFNTSADPSTDALPINSLPLSSRRFCRCSGTAKTICP